MEISTIDFETILPYWKNSLWKGFPEVTNKIDITMHEQYCLNLFKYLNQEQLEFVFSATYIACLIDGKIVGVESGYQTKPEYYRLRGLWVDVEYRRRGIATNLINYFESTIEDKYLWTIPRESALPFYESYGFKVTGFNTYTIYGKTFFTIKERNK